MPIALSTIEVPFVDDSVKLVNVVWSDQETTLIRVESKRTDRIAVVEFDSVAGLRMLDELDLAGYWLENDKQRLRLSWLFEVVAGGWYEQESQRGDFYMKHRPDVPKEFLVAGYSECVSILSYATPSVYELPLAQSASSHG